MIEQEVLFNRYFAVLILRSRNDAYGVVPNSFLKIRMVCDTERPDFRSRFSDFRAQSGNITAHLPRRGIVPPALSGKTPQRGDQRDDDPCGKNVRFLPVGLPKFAQTGLESFPKRTRLQQYGIDQPVSGEKIGKKRTVHIEPQLPPRRLAVGGIIVIRIRRNNIDVKTIWDVPRRAI